jgi:hypothetical protein
VLPGWRGGGLLWEALGGDLRCGAFWLTRAGGVLCLAGCVELPGRFLCLRDQFAGCLVDRCGAQHEDWIGGNELAPHGLFHRARQPPPFGVPGIGWCPGQVWELAGL